MSGKSKRPGWGGARTGSGRKPISHLSDAQVLKLHKVIKRRAKIEGRTWHEVLLDFVYGCERHDGAKVSLQTTAKERIAALKLLADLTIAKQSEQTVNVNKQEGPMIGLPPSKPDPAKLVALKGKEAHAA